MSDYSKTTNFGAKDALPTGNAAKVIKGSEHDTEYDNIATAVATKANKIASATDTYIVTMDSNGDLKGGGNATLTGGNMDVTGSVTSGSLVSDTLTAETTNGNLALDGNGTGIVTTDALSATTTNGNLVLTGNGTGEVTLDGNTIGNATGEIPISNGTVNTNLNAQKFNGILMQSGSVTTSSVTAGASGSTEVTLTDITTVRGVSAVIKGNGGANNLEARAIAIDDAGYVTDFGGDGFNGIFTAATSGKLKFVVINGDTSDQTFTIKYCIFGV